MRLPLRKSGARSPRTLLPERALAQPGAPVKLDRKSGVFYTESTGLELPKSTARSLVHLMAVGKQVVICQRSGKT
jgi:hypothetical protein